MGFFGSLAAKLCSGGRGFCFASTTGADDKAVDTTRVPRGKKARAQAGLQDLRQEDTQWRQSDSSQKKEVEFANLADLDPAVAPDIFVDNDCFGLETPPTAFEVQQSVFLDKENCFVEAMGSQLPRTPPPPNGFNGTRAFPPLCSSLLLLRKSPDDSTTFFTTCAGIPNGNKKFSEYKGITTHCTPFEERIERALKELDENNK